MSRQRYDYLHPQQPLQAIGEEAQAQAQAADSHTLVRAKELLCELWKAGRIDMYVRSEGDVALSAALWAIENPGAGKATKRIGALVAGEQWAREQERLNEPF